MFKKLLSCMIILFAVNCYAEYDGVAIGINDITTSTNKALANTKTSVPIYGKLEKMLIDVTLFSTGGVGVVVDLSGGMNQIATSQIYSNYDCKADTSILLTSSNYFCVGDVLTVTAWHSAKSTNDVRVTTVFSK